MLGQLIVHDKILVDGKALITPEGAISWLGLQEVARSFVSEHSRVARRRVGLSFTPTAASYAALAALDELSCDVFLLDAGLSPDEACALARKFRLACLIYASGTPDAKYEIDEFAEEGPWSGESTLTILTSGSTGQPKAARHTWESIARPVRKQVGGGATWFLAYRPQLYAGLQVMLQCFGSYGTLVTPGRDMDVRSTAALMRDTGVQFVSATPSYWRRLLMFAGVELLRKIPLAQITLGGEVVDQPVLDKLSECFPGARLVHIYATTELGRCFSVSDGKAGFPVRYLERPLPDGTELRVSDGELQVRSTNAMQMYDPLSLPQTVTSGAWFPTGDMVEVIGDRVFFVGRRSDVINVAGSKVFPIEVERVIRLVPGVTDVRVFGKSSSIAGELVACEIVVGSEHDPETLKGVVTRACREQLASYQQPRIVKIVERIDMSAAGKTLRTRTS